MISIIFVLPIRNSNEKYKLVIRMTLACTSPPPQPDKANGLFRLSDISWRTVSNVSRMIVDFTFNSLKES